MSPMLHSQIYTSKLYEYYRTETIDDQCAPLHLRFGMIGEPRAVAYDWQY